MDFCLGSFLNEVVLGLMGLSLSISGNPEPSLSMSTLEPSLLIDCSVLSGLVRLKLLSL